MMLRTATHTERVALAYLATQHPRPLRQMALLDGLAAAGLNSTQTLEAFCTLTSSGLVRLRHNHLSLTRHGRTLTAVDSAFFTTLNAGVSA